MHAAVETRVGQFGDGKMNGERNGKSADAIVFYQENFGVASPFVADELLNWIGDLGDELVIVAMKRAVDRNKTTWGYVKSILKSWQKKGIRTLADAEAERVAFEQERKQKYKQRSTVNSGIHSSKREIVPDWFEEEWKNSTEKRQKKQEKWEKEMTQEEAHAVAEELLEKYRLG